MYGAIAVKTVEILLCYILAVIEAFDVAETTKKSAGRHSYIGEVELEEAATCQPQRQLHRRQTPHSPNTLPSQLKINKSTYTH
jgi:hypothetical protein